jgi:hypothetical protein
MKGDVMQSKIIVGEKEYQSTDEPLKLLMVLRAHFERSLERESTALNDVELLTLKSWLLMHAESMQPGKAVWLEESQDGQVYKLVAALGRAPDGQSIVWHPPLPWPFDFENESRKII